LIFYALKAQKALLGQRKKGMQFGRFIHRKEGAMKYKLPSIVFLTVTLLIFMIGCEKKSEIYITASDGVNISCLVRGTGDPVIIFIHGWSNTGAIWDAQMKYFARKYKVIGIDLPGFGKSGNNRDDWTMTRLGADVATVITELDLDKVVLVGFSMGGPVAIEAANALPAEVAGVVLVDEMQNVEMRFPPPVASFMDSIMMDFVTNPTTEKLVAGGFFKMDVDSAFKQVQAMLKDAPMTGWRELLHDYMRWYNEDMVTTLKGLKVAVTAINSDKEKTNIAAFKELVPSFQAKIVPGVGHVIMWDDPQMFNQLLEESIQEFVN
jgi:pimeloyl-ACP methyl ester carboxylesterase